MGQALTDKRQTSRKIPLLQTLHCCFNCKSGFWCVSIVSEAYVDVYAGHVRRNEEIRGELYVFILYHLCSESWKCSLNHFLLPNSAGQGRCAQHHTPKTISQDGEYVIDKPGKEKGKPLHLVLRNSFSKSGPWSTGSPILTLVRAWWRMAWKGI